MPLTLTDDLARKMFSKHLKPDDGELTWIYGIDTPSLSMFLLFLGPILSAWKTKYYLVGLTERRLVLLKVSKWLNEKECSPIELSEITGAKVEESRDPYNMGSFVAMPGKKLSFSLKDGSRYQMGCLKDFKGIPGHGQNLDKISSYLLTLSALGSPSKQ
jgi:hypothetical protein